MDRSIEVKKEKRSANRHQFQQKETNLRYQNQDISQQGPQMTLEVYLLATLSLGCQPVKYT
jgi:hypothetical protein